MGRKGELFNIQPYSIHDGPGIRTTFFMKGCPLRCKWCQNPESQRCGPLLLTYESRCTGCGRCAALCPQGAIEMRDGKALTNRSKCTVCGACCAACPSSAREISGKLWTVDDLVQKALADKLFYDASGGGITVSGGDPLFQRDFVLDFLNACKAVGLHTALDTSGYAPWQEAEAVFKAADLILFDIKHMDEKQHLELTGVSNKTILDNLVRLHQMEKEIYIRLPIIPGMNDDEKNMRETAAFLRKRLDGKYRVFLLPYHSLGNSKLKSMGVEQGLLELEPPDNEHMQALKEIFEAEALKVQIGG